MKDGWRWLFQTVVWNTTCLLDGQQQAAEGRREGGGQAGGGADEHAVPVTRVAVRGARPAARQLHAQCVRDAPVQHGAGQ